MGALYATASVSLGVETASIVLAAVGITYATLNVLLGHSNDSPDAAHLITAALATTRVTYGAIALVWTSAVAMLVVPTALHALRAEFTIIVTDEQRRQVSDASVSIEGSWSVSPATAKNGMFIVKYYPIVAPNSVKVTVRRSGITRITLHALNSSDRFEDLVVPIWSGQTALSVTHLTAEGVAIGMFLRGDLPDELKRWFPRVSVLRNDVFEHAQRLISLYPPEGPVHRVDYQRDEVTSAGVTRRRSASAYLNETEGYEWLRQYGKKLEHVPAPSVLLGEFPLDFATDLLGAPSAAILPQGFIARFNAAEEWWNGDEVIPSFETGAWLTTAFGSVPRGPNGTMSMRIERLLTGSDLGYALAHQKPRNRSEWPQDRAAAAVMRQFIELGVPPGLVAGAIHLQWDEGCSYVQPHVAIHLPEPKLRVTVLQNVTSGPLRIDSIILPTEIRSRLERVGTQSASHEVQLPADTLAPGEGILIPRDLSFSAMYSDSEVSEFQLPQSSPAATFYVLPVSSNLDPIPGEPLPPPIPGPKELFLAPEQVRPGRPRALSESHGAPYFMGPSVRDVDYVINGVRMRARSDSRSAIRMIGVWEAGSCPFIFVQLTPKSVPLNFGHIIPDRVGVGAKGTDRINLPTKFVSLELRELEHEVTYVDQARLLVRRGRETKIYTGKGSIEGLDGRHAVLRKGEKLRLDFGYHPRRGDEAIQLEVTGYYKPLLPPAGSPLLPEARRSRRALSNLR